MKFFIDANILISVLNKEPTLHAQCKNPKPFRKQKLRNLYLVHLLTIAFYFVEQKSKTKTTLEKITLLCKHITIAEATNKVVQKTLTNKKVTDFEDGLEYYSAIRSKCAFIVTEDLNDFYFSKIPVLTARTFFEKHVAKTK
jgi:predicted nucleic acid-binding protein